MYIDSHCHLDRLKLSPYDNQLDGAILAAREAGVSTMLCVAIDLEHLDQVLAIAETYPDIYASVGVHPGTEDGEEPDLERLVALAQHDKVIAIGETGLDYYYGDAQCEQQKNRFITHLKAGAATAKPVIIHTRDAKEDTLKLIEEHADREHAGVLHCFTEDWDMAQRAMAMNFYISFSGIVTFKNAVELQDVARKMPMDRLLIETDSPYLAPVPFRGKPNEPRHVVHVAEKIAELKGLSVEEVAQTSADNFRKLFKVAAS
ncbi:MAG: hydrolase TatD [Oleiphilus sp.]|nr:MAG: hydrolase TatD [Oleiphilus sp.]